MFGYLDDAFRFEDNAPAVQESYGRAARPRTGFTSYVGIPVSGGTGRGSLVGEYAHDGRRELVVTFACNNTQRQFRLPARGIVEGLTQGVHLGQTRHSFAVHVDDVFAPDSRWGSAGNRTPGDFDCASGEGEGTTPVRMTADDATHAAQWQREHGFTMDMVFNAGSGAEWKTSTAAPTPPPPGCSRKAQYRWANHTSTHPFLAACRTPRAGVRHPARRRPGSPGPGARCGAALRGPRNRRSSLGHAAPHPGEHPVRRPSLLVALLVLLLAGCAQTPDDKPGPRWQPRPGTAWQWQQIGRAHV